MYINTSVPADNLQGNNPAPVRPGAQAPADSTSVPTAQPGLSANSLELMSSDLPISSEDAAGQSTQAARNSILNQSSLALLAHGQLHPQTVLDLLAQ